MADEAACWLFHPTQALERETDGALRVAFRTGGVQEMCWHLFTWGTAVDVVEPEGLRAELAEMAKSAMRHHSRRETRQAREKQDHNMGRVG